MLERSPELTQLRSWMDEAARGTGRLVLISGEMGIGKTTLVDALLREFAPFHRTTTVLCDGLSIPEPLGPVLDIAQRLGLACDWSSAETERRTSLFRAIEAVLRDSSGANLIVIEDVHWADDASMEFVRFLGRRIHELRTLAIMTYRDDELPSRNTLRQMIGSLASERSTRRLMLKPLSLDAVRALSLGSGFDPMALLRFTGGNPFFVTEILGARSNTPISIHDSILGRVARLDDEARETIDVASALGPRVDVPLLTSVLGRSVVQDITDAHECGLLRFDGASVEFRHAAIWSVIVGLLNPLEIQQLHGRILQTLLALPHEQDAARLAHHAELAGDLPAAFHWAVEAGNRAAALRSHREAASQFERALRCASELDPSEKAHLLESHALACSFTSRLSDAIRSQQEAAEIWEALGDNVRYGHNLWRLSRYWYFDGRYRRASTLVEESYRVLRSTPDSIEFVLVSGHVVEWRIRANRLDEARQLAAQISGVAYRLGDATARLHADITSAMVKMAMNEADGFPEMEEAYARAIFLGHQEFELRALCYLANTHGIHRQRSTSRAWVDTAIDVLRDSDVATNISLLSAVRAETLLDRCAWGETVEEADAIVAESGNAGRLLLDARLTRERALLQSGSPDVNFTSAAELVARLDDPIAAGKLAALRLEASWLIGATAPSIADTLLTDIQAAGDATTASELALWLVRTGTLAFDVAGWMVDPFKSELAGDYRTAARIWEDGGAPLLALRAMASSGEEADLRNAHLGMLRLGAKWDAARIARILQQRGIRGIPRGPRPTTRMNAASLTNREMEVLGILAQGCTDREIARRLSVSEKTVGSQVSAVLRKLQVSNRTQAVVRAQELGLIAR